MNIVDFSLLLVGLSARWKFSVVSWGRSEKHNAAVGGLPNSMHLYFLAVDVVLDDEKDTILFCEAVRRCGLISVNEPGHLHVQAPRISEPS